eukprot:11602-Heterococcus_DN1.PRE.2
MDENRATKRIVAVAALHHNPFNDENIVRKVMSCAGAGQWFFLAPVCKLWRDLYAQLSNVSMDACSATGHRRTVTCHVKMTPYSSVFAAPSRIKLARESGVNFTTQTFKHSAGAYADTETLTAAHELGMQYSATTMIGAARCNKLAVLQFLRDQGCAWNNLVIHQAIKRDDLEMVRWPHENGCEWSERCALKYAAQSGNIELMHWVQQRVDQHFTAQDMRTAVQQGRTDVCEYLHSQQCPISPSALETAAGNGDVILLQWLHQHGNMSLLNTLEVCKAAASSGSVDVMEYLREQHVLTANRVASMLSVAVDLRIQHAGTATGDKYAAAKQWLHQRQTELALAPQPVVAGDQVPGFGLVWLVHG